MEDFNTAGVTDVEVAKALDFFRKAQESRKKAAEKRASDPQAKEKARYASLKTNARIRILAQKAKDAGFTVSDEEVDAYLAGDNE